MANLNEARARPGHWADRLGASALGLVVGCLTAMVAVPVWITLMSDEGLALGWDFLPLVWLVAGGAWLVTVVPIALWADHRRRFFDRRAAPLVGALCGVAALLAFWSLWFLAPPWYLFLPPLQWDWLSMLGVAAAIGAAIWTVYTRAVRHLE